MKKVSEMSLEELQDEVLQRREESAAFADKEGKLKGEISELTGLNKALQTRNNALLMKVETQGAAAEEPGAPKEEKIESCEDFAARIAKGEI